MANSSVDISFITINYNGWKDTSEFIESCIQHIHSVSYEIIVIDNASQNHEAQTLQLNYPQIKVICNNQNMGFARANNIGIDVANGKYLFFLNNDVLLIEDNISDLIYRLESDSLIAGVSPLIRNNDKQHTIQFAGYTPLSTITLRNKAIGEGDTDKFRFPAKETPFMHGAAMLLKRSVIESTGKMPECYFLYYEELDWCTMITRNGYKLWYDPAMQIIHKGSNTIGTDSPLKAYYMSRNRLLYARRNRKGIQRFLCTTYLLTISLPVQIFRAIAQNRKDLAKAHWKGVLSYFNRNY